MLFLLLEFCLDALIRCLHAFVLQGFLAWFATSAKNDSQIHEAMNLLVDKVMEVYSFSFSGMPNTVPRVPRVRLPRNKGRNTAEYLNILYFNNYDIYTLSTYENLLTQTSQTSQKLQQLPKKIEQLVKITGSSPL